MQTGDGAKRQRVPTAQTKAGSVLKPIRGNNTNHSNHSINQRAEANNFTQTEQKRKKVVVNGALSADISCLESEVPELRPLDTPREDVHEDLDEENPSETASSETVKDVGDTLMTETAVEKPRNHNTVRNACASGFVLYCVLKLRHFVCGEAKCLEKQFWLQL